jgi:hypothetical protein
VLAVILMLAGARPVAGTGSARVQAVTGHLEAKEDVLYRIANLSKGDMLYIHAKGTSGNFDPMVVLLKRREDFKRVRHLFAVELQEAIARGEDPLIAPRRLLDKFSLAWNDDRDGNYDAVLRLRVPADGDYTLLLKSGIGYQSFGNYRLLVGVNAPAVLTGDAPPTGARFVVVDELISSVGKGVAEALTGDKYLRLVRFDQGETLYVHVEATSGNLKPVVTLYDFGDKPLRIANFTGRETTAVLQYTFPRSMKNCRLKISGQLPDKTVTTGGFRALIGLNAPGVLEGKGHIGGRAILKKPIPVKIGIKMQQISNVDQKAENYGVVATLMMKWEDPALAFRPDKFDEPARVYTGDAFTRKMVEEANLWPQFTLFNQQGNRWIQNSVAAVFSDGKALYLERFSVTLQAPDFDFRRFPLDRQQFFIRVESIFPNWFFVYEDLDDYSAVGRQLGEEEWVVTDFETIIDRAEIAERPVSRFNFRFEAKRHLTYYVFRILLPVLIIIMVSWIIFFLKDYAKRVDAAAANLLLFIAFNFTISSDLPRLGYMTFLDMVMISAFVVTALMLILAVALRRMVTDGKKELVNRIDRYVLIFYPLAYVVGIGLVLLFFL